jgi:hypothetical protein
VEWIAVALDKESWQTVVNTVMNHRVLLNAWNFLTCSGLSATQESLCSLQQVICAINASKFSL